MYFFVVALVGLFVCCCSCCFVLLGFFLFYFCCCFWGISTSLSYAEYSGPLTWVSNAQQPQEQRYPLPTELSPLPVVSPGPPVSQSAFLASLPYLVIRMSLFSTGAFLRQKHKTLCPDPCNFVRIIINISLTPSQALFCYSISKENMGATHE